MYGNRKDKKLIKPLLEKELLNENIAINGEIITNCDNVENSNSDNLTMTCSTLNRKDI